jgi:uncharacterized membrane protein
LPRKAEETPSRAAPAGDAGGCSAGGLHEAGGIREVAGTFGGYEINEDFAEADDAGWRQRFLIGPVAGGFENEVLAGGKGFGGSAKLRRPG